MIIYGVRGKVIAGESYRHVVCQHCGNDSHLSFGVLRYFHLYWIPAFVFQKKTGLECLHCKKTIFDREIPSDIRSKITEKVFTNKNVLPMFSGLAIIIIIFLVIVLASAS